MTIASVAIIGRAHLRESAKPAPVTAMDGKLNDSVGYMSDVCHAA